MVSTESMSDPDDPLLADVRALLAREDAVPNHVLAAAHAAIEFRSIDAAIAELLSDTALDDSKELAGVRGEGQRSLTFGFEETFVEVDVAAEGESVVLAGYVVPGESGTVVVEYSGGTASERVDERGRFGRLSVRSGLVRLRLECAGKMPLQTPWFAI